MKSTNNRTTNRLDGRALGLAVGLFLAFTFVICVLWDLILPELVMYQTWMQLHPGFEWILWGSFLLGLAETFFYGIFFGFIFAPLYNFFVTRLASI
jgi:hypothetical protein